MREKKTLRICFCSKTDSSEESGNSWTQMWCKRGSRQDIGPSKHCLSSHFLYLQQQSNPFNLSNKPGYYHLSTVLCIGQFFRKLASQNVYFITVQKEIFTCQQFSLYQNSTASESTMSKKFFNV